MSELQINSKYFWKLWSDANAYALDIELYIFKSKVCIVRNISKYSNWLSSCWTWDNL